jgi:hypothetical protein
MLAVHAEITDAPAPPPALIAAMRRVAQLRGSPISRGHDRPSRPCRAHSASLPAEMPSRVQV